MGFFTRLFARETTSRRESLHAAASGPNCLHVAVAPKWDSAADVGHEDRATAFVCDACHRSFSPTEFEQVRTEAVRRLRKV